MSRPIPTITLRPWASAISLCGSYLAPLTRRSDPPCGKPSAGPTPPARDGALGISFACWILDLKPCRDAASQKRAVPHDRARAAPLRGRTAVCDLQLDRQPAPRALRPRAHEGQDLRPGRPARVRDAQRVHGHRAHDDGGRPAPAGGRAAPGLPGPDEGDLQPGDLATDGSEGDRLPDPG